MLTATTDHYSNVGAEFAAALESTAIEKGWSIEDVDGMVIVDGVAFSFDLDQRQLSVYPSLTVAEPFGQGMIELLRNHGAVRQNNDQSSLSMFAAVSAVVVVAVTVYYLIR